MKTFNKQYISTTNVENLREVDTDQISSLDFLQIPGIIKILTYDPVLVLNTSLLFSSSLYLDTVN